MADCDDEMDDMDPSSELEAELYARIHYETGTTTLSADFVKPAVIKNQMVTKRSIVNDFDNKTDASKIRKEKSSKVRPNTFAISSALNNTNLIIPKRLTPYTSYLSQIYSKPVDMSDKKIDQQPNPEKKINRLHSMTDAANISKALVKTTEQKPLQQITSIIVDSDTDDDDLIILPPVIPPIYLVNSSDEEDATAKAAYSKGKKANRIMSGSDSEVETSNQSKRMRKRKSSGSNRRCSDHVSDDSGGADAINDVVEKDVVRPFVFRGEAIPNAITTTKSKRTAKNMEKQSDQEFTTLSSTIIHCDKSKEQPGYIDMDGDSSNESNTDSSIGNSSNWLVKDQVGTPDDIEIDSSIPNDISENGEIQQDCEEKEQDESNVGDKDDENCVRSKPLVIHPEMGWNNEMKAFYNDSWGGDSYDSKALRKQMPPTNSTNWPIAEADRRANYHFKTIKCLNCRESGHRMQYCPQPRRAVVCHTCGTADHRSNRCPNAICLQCGAKSNSYTYVNGCKDCLYLNAVHCTRCRVRGHLQKDCPENWRSYHNTIDSVSSPKYVPNPHRPKKYCCICAAPGHIAEQCHLLKEEMPSTTIRRYEKVHCTNILPIDNSNTTPYVMFEKPREDFEFNWNVNESKDRFYGRFMEATKIVRDPRTKANLGARRAKRRRLNDYDDVVVDSSNEKMVLNQMKPKKQFSKDVYAESTKSAIAQSNNCETNVNSANVTAESIFENPENEQLEGFENGLSVVIDIVMKETKVVPELTKDDEGNVEEKIQADSGDGVEKIMERKELKPSIDYNALMLEAIEVDKLKRFSFEKEMEKFEKSKSKLGTNFNGESTDFHVVKKLSETKTETNENLKRRLSTSKTEYIPLSSTRIESPTNIANQERISQHFTIPSPSTKGVKEVKIFLSKEHTRTMLTEAGNIFLRESSTRNQIKVTMGWESVSNVLMVVGSKLNRNKFHADLVKYLEDMNKKNRQRNETLQFLPKSKVALIRFIREQFDLLLQPLGNPQLLYNNMRVNENLMTKAGTKNANKSRIKLNTVLMGQGGLRDGPKHLSGLEKNLKFLLKNNKDMITKQLRQEIFEQYRYIFSSYTHDDYPELISEFNELKNSNNLPEMKVDRRLLELNTCAKNENCRPVDLDLAKRKLMHMKNEESPQRSGKLAKLEPNTPKLDKKSPKAEMKSPTQDPKSSKISKLEATYVPAIASEENADNE